MNKFIVTIISVLFFSPYLNQSASANTYSENEQNKLDGYEYVDLALPSGTLWAKYNVGATEERGTGYFFAWGETKPKEVSKFVRSTYKYYKEEKHFNQVWHTSYKLTKYNNNSKYGVVDNKNMLDTNDDAVIALWGENWCMPSKDQALELYKNCKKEDIYADGKRFQRFTGKNGNYIILPVYGYYVEEFNGGSVPYSNNGKVNTSSLTKKKEEAYYWTKDLGFSTGCGYALRIGYFGVLELSRHFGANIRAVVSKKGYDLINETIQNSGGGYRSNSIIPRDIYVTVNGKSVPLYNLPAKTIDSIADSPQLDMFKYERVEIAQETKSSSSNTSKPKTSTNTNKPQVAIQIQDKVPWRDWDNNDNETKYLTIPNYRGESYVLKRLGNHHSSYPGAVYFGTLSADPKKLTSKVFIDNILIRKEWQGVWKDNLGRTWNIGEYEIAISYVKHLDMKSAPPSYAVRQKGVEHIIADFKYDIKGIWIAAGNLFFLQSFPSRQLKYTSPKVLDGWVKDLTEASEPPINQGYAVCEIICASRNEIVLKSQTRSRFGEELILKRIK